MTPGLGESVVQNYSGGDVGGGLGGTDTADQDYSSAGGGQDQDYSGGDAGSGDQDYSSDQDFSGGGQDQDFSGDDSTSC